MSKAVQLPTIPVSVEHFLKVSKFASPKGLTLTAVVEAAIDRMLRGPIAKRKTRTEELS